MPRELETEHEAALDTAGRRSTLKITLGDGTELYFSTADTEFDDIVYLGKLAPVDDLNLDATQATEGSNLKISNITLSLGQNLINTPDVLSGTKAVFGTYFHDEETDGEWHDVKLKGKITVNGIDGDWIELLFESTVSSTIHNGVTIASLFPDAQIPTKQLPQQTNDSGGGLQPIYNDIDNIQNSKLARQLSPLTDDMQFGGRYFLPLSA